MRRKNVRRNIKLLIKYIISLLLLITAYSIFFHYLMEAEGRNYSWITGFYWTLTVMSTLGFGDITFTGDTGKIFSIIVMLSGVMLLLVLLPFTFIQFFFAPWMEAERESRTPRKLPSHISNHVIITGYNSVTSAFIEKLLLYRRDYTLVVEDVHRALELYDMGIKASVGNIDDPETYRLMKSHEAAMVVAANTDEVNTNVAFTVREMNENVPIICTADSEDSVDILRMAGASLVLRLPELLGQSLSRRVAGGDRKSSVIGMFDSLLIAEAPAAGTPMMGKTLLQIKLREIAGVTAVGVWERGKFTIAGPETLISPSTVLVLAGSEEQIESYEELMCIYQPEERPVIIIGGGRVGLSVGQALAGRRINYTIVDKAIPAAAQPLPGCYEFIDGNAADISTLKKAGIENASAVIITTHDDATNIYLAKYCSSLRPDMQIISRANADRNVSTLHRAGADFVMSYAALGANIIYNYLEDSRTVMLAEGLGIFRRIVPRELEGRTLAQSGIRQETGCSVMAIKKESAMRINPAPGTTMEKGDEIIVLGTVEAEKKFMRLYC